MGARVIDNLGVVVDTFHLNFFSKYPINDLLQLLSKKLLVFFGRNARLVSVCVLQILGTISFGLFMALPLPRFYSRSLYSDMPIFQR